MTFKEIIAIILGAALANNCAFRAFLGVTPIMGWSKRMDKSVVMGLAVLGVMLLTEAVCWPLYSLVLVPAELTFLQIPAFVGVVLVWTYVLNAIAKAVFKKPLGVFFPVIALNGAVLGLAMTALELSFGGAMLTAFGTGLGFIVAIFAFSAVEIKLRINAAFVPNAFKGLPIELLAAGIVSLAFFAF